MTRILALILAYLFLALAIIGVFLPGLPTVPFLLLTAWFAARGSERLHTWLYAHPHLGKLLIDWEQQRAISRTSKVLAVLMLIGSWTFLFFRLDNVWLFSGVTVLFICVSTFIVTRAEPQPALTEAERETETETKLATTVEPAVEPAVEKEASSSANG